MTSTAVGADRSRLVRCRWPITGAFGLGGIAIPAWVRGCLPAAGLLAVAGSSAA